MVGSIASLVVKLTFVRAVLALLASVAVVLPLGLALLKFLALPLLVVMGLLGLPLLVVIALLGFPLFIVFAIAGVVLALLGAVVSFGFVALKIFLFVVLPLWLLWRFMRFAFGGRRAGATATAGGEGGAAPGGAPDAL